MINDKLTVNQLNLMDHVVQKAERYYYDQCQACRVSWNAYILVTVGTLVSCGAKFAILQTLESNSRN
jgi:hypothetical protein